MRSCWAAILAAGFLAAPSTAHSAQNKTPEDLYRQTLRRVFLIANSPNVRLLPMGRSVDGRAIPALAISDFRTDVAGKVRIFICAGQHGDETAPVRSAVSLCAKLASGRYPAVLETCVVIVAPIVNPDGLAARHRLNDQGIDLNRDWTALRTPETRHINGLIGNWKPQVLLDVHEWVETLPAHADAIEAVRCTPKARQAATACFARDAGHASGLGLVWSGPASDRGLFHRRYASLGYGAYLLETASGGSLDAKSRAYAAAIMTVIDEACAAKDALPELSPASAAFRPSAVSASLAQPTPEGESPSPFSESSLWAGVIVAGIGVVLVVITPTANPKTRNWSRRFKKCDLQDAIPAAMADRSVCPASRGRSQLVPITARSWVHRRTRARYAPSNGA